MYVWVRESFGFPTLVASQIRVKRAGSIETSVVMILYRCLRLPRIRTLVFLLQKNNVVFGETVHH